MATWLRHRQLLAMLAAVVCASVVLLVPRSAWAWLREWFPVLFGVGGLLGAGVVVLAVLRDRLSRRRREQRGTELRRMMHDMTDARVSGKAVQLTLEGMTPDPSLHSAALQPIRAAMGRWWSLAQTAATGSFGSILGDDAPAPSHQLHDMRALNAERLEALDKVREAVGKELAELARSE